MDVDYLCFWVGRGVKTAVRSESQKLDVLAGVVGVGQQSFYEGVIASADCIVLPLHLFSQQNALLGLEIPREARKQWKDNIHHKPFIVVDSFSDSEVDGIGDLVFDGG